LGSQQPSKSQATQGHEEDAEISEDVWTLFPLTQKKVAIPDGSALTETMPAPPFTNHRGQIPQEGRQFHCPFPPPKPGRYEKQRPHEKTNT